MASGIKLTKDEFIERANIKHENKYDYSLVSYKNNKTKVIIICPIHGEFLQAPDKHLDGNECPACGRIKSDENRIKSFDDFLGKANKIHNGFYNYSKTVFKNRKDKAIITCPKHGDFNQVITNHLCGRGCPVCANEKRTQTKPMPRNEFINRANSLHRYQYDYTHVVYKNAITDVKIICKKHGEFKQLPSVHLRPAGCPECSYEKVGFNNRKDINIFIQESINKHSNKFDYSKVNYVNSLTNVLIVCNKHGEFWQTPENHLKSTHGCPKCVLEAMSGKNHSNYNPNLTDEDRLKKRDVKENVKWRNDVFKRDDYKCVKCSNGGYLHAHHLNGYHWATEERFNTDNGTTLCKDCHDLFHDIYGKKNNTKEQFEEFMQLEFDNEDFM